MESGRRNRLVLLAATVVVLIGLCSGLPWEDVERVIRKQRDNAALSSQRGFAKRAGGACPVHPLAVDQQFITQRYMPDSLRKALSQLDLNLQTSVKRMGIIAASVGVIYDQELIWGNGYGFIDPSDPSTKADTNTVYRIGSISKLITDIMLFKLRDEGKISLDDPISKYVPQLAWDSPYKNNPGLTWRSLAGQTSGLTGTTPCNFFTIWEPILGDACDISNEEAWKRVTAMPPTAPQWEYPHYADGAYAIIGRALEVVVGMSYEDYVTNEILKPLGMLDTYMAYSSDIATRVPPGKLGNSTYPQFVAQCDLNWARPTGNLYSTVNDLAKLASLFMVGQGEEKNVLGIYSSTLREMLTPSFINDDQVSGYGFPFEIIHTSAFGANMPAYWVRGKAGAMPGYTSMIGLLPEIKTAVVVQSSQGLSYYQILADLLPAMEQTLWDLQPLPTNPGNLTAFAGTYLASVLYGSVIGNATVEADEAHSQLILSFSIAGALSGMQMGKHNASWVSANSFQVMPAPGQSCLNVESGFTNVMITFTTGDPAWGGDPTKVVSLSAPADPFYDWVFVKQ